jgi:hypothetical protein
MIVLISWTAAQTCTATLLFLMSMSTLRLVSDDNRDESEHFSTGKLNRAFRLQILECESGSFNCGHGSSVMNPLYE